MERIVSKIANVLKFIVNQIQVWHFSNSCQYLDGFQMEIFQPANDHSTVKVLVKYKNIMKSGQVFNF